MSRYRVVSYSDYCLKAERRSEGKNRYRVDLKKSYAALCKDAELAWCTPHILRHTFGSLLAQSNVSLYKIANWMGHSKPSTTQIYAHLVPMKSDLGVFD